MLLWLSCCGILQAQNREIPFESLGFNDALKKAGTEGKYLFLDCQTSWCGPCKLMAKEVFTLDSIADFFRANFISLKMDMEAGEGIQLKEKFKVDAYPTFLLIDGRGNEIFRMIGQQSAAGFMKKIREGMKPENSVTLLTAQYNKGKRTPDFIYQYCKALKQGMLSESLQEVIAAYFGKMSVKNICNDKNWKIYDEFVTGINNPVYHRLIEDIEKFKALKGAQLIEDKLNSEYGQDLFRAISKEPLTPAQYKQYSQDIEKIGLKDPQQLFYLRSYLDLANLRSLGKYDELLDLIEAGPEGYEPERRTTLVMTIYFMADGTIRQRLRAGDLLIREAKAIMAEEGGQLPPNIGLVMGYVQAKLQQGATTSTNPDSLCIAFKQQYKQEAERLGQVYPINLQNVDTAVWSVKQKHAGLMKFIKYSGLPADTIAVLEASTTMQAYSSLLNMENMMRWIAKVDTILPPSYYNFAGTLNLNIPEWKKVAGINSFLDSYFAAMERVGKLASDRTNYLLRRAELIGDPQVCEDYLIHVLRQEMNLGYCESLPETVKTIEPFIVSAENKAVLEDLQRKQQEIAKQHVRLNRGQKAGDLSGRDKDGKVCSLKAFVGKVVVVDVWSTNCLPCIGEMPYLQQLERQFAGKDVVFISYSIDRNKDSWVKFLENKKWDGIQLIDTGGPRSPFVQHYAIHSTPRLILIGKDGRIADSRGPKPSDPLLAKEIEELLRK